MPSMNGRFFRFFLMHKIWISVWLCSCFSANADVSLTFLKEFVAHPNFHSPLYTLISCWESESVSLVKLFSTSSQKFAAVRTVDKGLRAFVKYPQTFVLDLRCSRATEILQQAENLSLFGKPFQWLLLTSREANDKSRNFSETGRTWSSANLENLSVSVNSEVKIAERNSGGKIAITGVYKIQENLIEEPLAHWTPEKGFAILNSNPTAVRRWNLRGANVTASFVLTRRSSYYHLEDLVDRHVDTTTKLSYNVVKLYGELFNASVTYKVAKEWGEILPNGSWTGMIGYFQRNEADYGGSPLFFRKDRLSEVEYYAMVTPSRFKFLFLSPPVSYSSNIFLMPFDSVVWYCCLVVIAASCVLLYVTAKFETPQEGKFEDFSFSEILILNIGAICLQGTSVNTKKPPGRIIVLFAYFGYMFLYNSYSAAIVAIIQSSDTSVRSLTDFLKSPLKAGAEDVPYSKHYFTTASDKVRVAIYRKKIAPKGQPPHFLPVEEGIEKVRKGFYAYHVELNAGYEMVQKKFTEEEKCALQELSESFFRYSDPWLVMRRNNPYAELLKIGVKRCIERGFKSRTVRRYFTKKPTCKSKSARFVKVGVSDCYYAFVLLLGGMVLAVGVMLLELGFSRYIKRWERRMRVKTTPEYQFVN